MADDYKYKNLPRAANGIAPAYWDEEEKQWLPYQGGADMVKELNDIKATQAKILERLDKPLDTQVTGSYMEYRINSTDTKPEAKVDEKGAILIYMDTGEIFMNRGGIWGEF